MPMLAHDGIAFAEDIESYQFYGFDGSEDLVAIDSMSAPGKQPRFDMSLLSMNFSHDNGLHESVTFGPFIEPAYVPQITNQQDLTAIPTSFGLDIENGSPYSYTYEYPPSRLSSIVTQAHQAVSSPAFSQPAALKPVLNECYQPSKKRKASIDSFSENDTRLTKKVEVALQDTNGDFHDLSAEPSPYSSFVPTPAPVPAFPSTQRLSGSPRTANHHYSTSNASQISVPGPPPYTPTVSPSFTNANTEQSPRAPATPAPRPASAASYAGTNPKLVRTSTIPQQSPPVMASGVGIPAHTHAFNPYTMYSPNAKARLTLEGDLNDIAKNWSSEELDARRKIVVFSRSQKGNEISANFKVVSQKEWSRQPGTVNCIWWKERNDAFVTSVDTIALLEELVHVRFTVEEKNRIRRNLEGFKPLTVSKAKPDSEDFFKVIMGFPNPKPRNIEKDVKVFPWRILTTALCKIISKYSASYASTASALSGAPAQLYRPVEGPQEFQYPSSPGQDYQSSNGQPVVITKYETDVPHGRVSAPVTPMPNLQVVTPAAHGYEMSQPYSYGPMPVTHGNAAYPAYPMTAPAAPGPHYWNFTGYPQHEQVHMVPVSAPPVAHVRGMFETADFGGIAAHQMMHR